jgi:hypothetical protein
MGSAQFLLRLRVSPAHRAPANAGTDKRVDKPELEEITKAEREFVLDLISPCQTASE